MHPNRIDQFVGNDLAYIEYLERIVRSLRPTVSPPSPPITSGSAQQQVIVTNNCQPIRRVPHHLSTVTRTPYPTRTVKKERTAKADQTHGGQRWKQEADEMVTAMISHMQTDSRSDPDFLFDTILCGGNNPQTSIPGASAEENSQQLKTLAIAYSEYPVWPDPVVKNCREFIVVSLCVAMLNNGITTETVNSIMPGTSSSLKYLDKIRKGNLWANKMIFELAEGCFVFGSTQEFLLCAQSAAQYSRFTESERSFLYIMEMLWSREWEASRHSLPFAVPFFVKNIVGNTMSLLSICEALGYRYHSDYIAQQHRYFDQVRETRNRNSCKLPPMLPLTSGFFDNLEHKELVALLVFLGDSQVSKVVLRRATCARTYFNLQGEFDSAPPPYSIPALRDDKSLDSALQYLESLNLITTNKALDSIMVHYELQQLVEKDVEGYSVENMKYMASNLVFHAFPTDPDTTDGLTASLCESQLPQVQYILTYFDAPEFIKRFSPTELEQAVAVCLSSSGFSQRHWKRKVLSTAERIMRAGQGNPLLSAKIRLRRKVLVMQDSTEVENYLDSVFDGVSRTNPTSNAFFGQVILCKVQVMIDQNKHTCAWQELEKFKPWNPTNPSTEERRILQTITLLRHKISRFLGDMPTAARFLEKMDDRKLFKRVVPGYMSSAVAVCCELGKFHTARRLLPEGQYIDQPWADLKAKGRRVSIAAAGTYFMEGLWMLVVDKRELADAQTLFSNAEAIYKHLEKVYLNTSNPGKGATIRHFAASAGLAVMSHLASRFGADIKLEEVLSNWQSAWTVAERLGNFFSHKPGFPEMIISYSMTDVLKRLGRLSEATEKLNLAKNLYETTGRQFQWLALGSIWFDMVGDWIESDGWCRICKLRYDDYLEGQRPSFPYDESSLGIYLSFASLASQKY